VGQAQGGGERKTFPVLREAAARLAEVIPGAQRRTLEGETHNVAPKILAPVLQEFFDRGETLN
jgi:hypothetical protein